MPVDNVRDLGVIIDSKLTMESHVQGVARSCFYKLRQLRSIHRSLTANARRLLAVAFKASQVDYCNAVLHGIPDRVVQQLQMVMNAATRFVARTPHQFYTRCASLVAGLQENSVQDRFAGF